MSAWIQAAVVLVVLAAVHVPLGNYLTRDFTCGVIGARA